MPELVEGGMVQHDVSSVKVLRAADIGVIDRRPVRGLSRCAALEFVLEDGGDGRIGGGVDLQGSFAGGLQPFRSVGLGEAKDADTGAEALFGVRPVAHDDIDQDLGIGSHRRGPASDARRCPTGITPVLAPVSLNRRSVTTLVNATPIHGEDGAVVSMVVTL